MALSFEFGPRNTPSLALCTQLLKRLAVAIGLVLSMEDTVRVQLRYAAAKATVMSTTVIVDPIKVEDDCSFWCLAND